MNQTEDLIMAQLEYYADRIAYFTNEVPDIELVEFFRDQAQSLLEVEDLLELMTMTYYRYMSESLGVVFEIDHGDPELMFGGID